MNWGEKMKKKHYFTTLQKNSFTEYTSCPGTCCDRYGCCYPIYKSNKSTTLLNMFTKAFTLCQSCPPYPSCQHTRWTLLYTASTNNNKMTQRTYQACRCKKSNATSKLCQFQTNFKTVPISNELQNCANFNFKTVPISISKPISNERLGKKKKCRPNHPSTLCIRINVPSILTAKTNGLALEWKHVNIF